MCKPTGSIIFIGPLFQSTTACWGCLKARLSSHNSALLFLSKHGYTDKVRLPVDFNKFSLNIAFTLCLFNLAIKASMSRAIVQDIDLLSYDLFTNSLTTHVLGKIESCEVCNNGSNYQVISGEKIEETNTYTPAKFLSQLEKLISPITGIVGELNIKEPWQEGLFYLAYAYHPLITRFEDIESFLGNFGSITSCGKGKTLTEAKIGAIGEAVERYSGVLQGNEKIINASLAELGKQAIHPNDVLLISDEQYITNKQINQTFTPYHRTPLIFPDNRKFNWSPVISLTSTEIKYLPTAFCYYSNNKEERPYIIANSNGSAARDTKDNALIYGFLELFERDAVAIWWYNRLSMPGVNLQKLNSDFIKRVEQYLYSLERNLWILNITNDLNVPVFVALSKCYHIERQDIIFGFGCHFDPIIAIEKAVLELLQVLESVFDKDDNGTIEYVYSNVDAKKWWDEARTSNQPYLLPKDNISNDLANYNFVIIKDNNSLENCINIIKKARLEAYYIDQTRKDIGVAVVKVIVPGLRHLGRSFAPGRLFDVPVKMGWTKKPTLEKDLNPYPIFF
ncbi:MAG: YcaO-like family protein [Rickettsia endosymbiont of Labidopullus appendiculatus]|nr:YcaO-like family protein [Rickettsia endosymbiont of Labidopullus appendiculatus]